MLIEGLKDRFTVCGSEEEGTEEIRFSSVPDFTEIKLVICLGIQQACTDT